MKTNTYTSTYPIDLADEHPGMEGAPPAVPAEGSWSGNPADLPNWEAMPRRNRRRRRRAPYPIWLKYFAWCVGLAVLVTGGQIAVHAIRSDPRDAKVFAERELQFSTLRPNERVLAKVSVWQRPLIDYFRATRGLLVLTESPPDADHPIGGRLIYLGLQPRDPLSSPDAPPTFDERAWPIDTLARVTPTRTLFKLARGLQIRTPTGTITVGVPSGASSDADTLLKGLNAKYAQLRGVGWQRREVRRAQDRARTERVAQGRQEWFHTVKRGEAVASIAKMFNTTPEEVRTLNSLTSDKIKAGQRLRVKGWTKQAVPFPAGAIPEMR